MSAKDKAGASAEPAKEPLSRLLIHTDAVESASVSRIKQMLEKGQDDEKILAMKQTISMLLSGQPAPQLLVPIIRFVMPSKNHTIKKLVLLYLEVVDKNNDDGTFILVVNGLLRDLNYPNEYVRGSCLRFLGSLRQPDLLVPLLESVRQNLQHRNAYVKRQAVIALHAIHDQYPHLLPDAPDLLYEVLQSSEDDNVCKRNAFMALFSVDRDKALEYINNQLDSALSLGEILQLVLLQLIRRAVLANPEQRGRYLRTVHTLLSAPSVAVQYEAAHTLTALTSAPTAVRAATQTYLKILVSASDNNVKLVVLDRLLQLRKSHSKVLQRLVMDVLRALQSPAADIRAKTPNWQWIWCPQSTLERSFLL